MAKKTEIKTKSLKALTKRVKGELVAIASNEEIDRVGDSIKAGGWQLDNFKKNPVIQFAHRYDIPPVGIAKEIWVEGKELLFKPVFHEITPLAKQIKAMYETNPPIMRAFSVGFIPKMADEKDAHSIMEQELLEISAVPVPA